jgi:hypothetical protein
MAGPIRTQFAMKALDLSEIFKSVVGAEPVLGADGDAFTVELSAPDGPSTGGGKQSVQHIKLVRTGLTIVVGSADQVDRSVELRSFEYVSQLHAQRYKGAALPVDRASYDAYVKRARTFFSSQQLSVVLKDAAPQQESPAKGGGSSSMGLIIGAILVVAGVAAAVFLLMRH